MNVNKGTVTRAVLLVLALINQGLAIFGQSPIPVDEQQVEMFISMVFTGVTAVWSWWKNNSFTKPAKEGDKVKDQMKKSVKGSE